MVSPEDAQLLTQPWYASVAGRKRKITYAARGRKPSILLHREVLKLQGGEVNGDHKDGNGLDNRRGNLRPVDDSQSVRNRSSATGSTSHYLGVSWQSATQKWKSAVQSYGKEFFLGYFIEETDAARAYDKGAVIAHGEYARLNLSKGMMTLTGLPRTRG
jgi:hypothetical protein